MTYSRCFALFTVILVSATMVATSASAQVDASAESVSSLQTQEDPFEMDSVENQLKPADTSSPRDTLRSFLTDINIVIDEWRRNEAIDDQVGYRAYERALSTLDFSMTRDSDSRLVMNRRMQIGRAHV